MGEISAWEWMVLLIIVLLVVGPDKLPGLAAELGSLVRRVRVFLRDAGATVKEEFGEELEGIDLTTLDPRQYDPRRIVRDALREPLQPPAPGANRSTRKPAPQPGPEAAPFDGDAT